MTVLNRQSIISTMDVKVYKKEEVLQPSGKGEYVYVPDVIDLIPNTVEFETTNDITNNIWSLKNLQAIADVKIVGNKLVINSDNVKFENGRLIVTIKGEQILSVETLDDNTRDLIEQSCSLATIWQRGLDPLDLNDGIRWSEAILEEINSIQLMQDIIEAVADVTPSVNVSFDTVEDDKGNIFLTYKLSEVM